MIVKSSRMFVASSCVQLFRVLISQSMYPVKWCWEAGAVWWCPGQGCAGEHLNAAVSQNIGAAAPLTHGHQMAASHQQPSCSLSPSGDLSLSSANLLTDNKNANILHEIFIDEGRRRYDDYNFYLEL